MPKQPQKPALKSINNQPIINDPAVTTSKAPPKKPSTAAPHALTLLLDAVPDIISPVAGSITANTNLTVTIDTNREDLPYVITLLDITGRPAIVYTNNIAAPGTNPFTHVIPGTALASGRTFKITLIVDPSAGSTPPHDFDDVTVTT